MNDQELLNKAYLVRKDDKSISSYNFDLFEMMNDFDFYDFCDKSRNTGDYSSCEHGGLLVITDKQYILTYNSSFGMGTHVGAEARVYTDIHGGGKISDDDKAFDLSLKCNKKYICARIVYEYNYGYIQFVHHKDDITLGMLRNFEKFYNDYSDDIKYTSKCFNFYIIYSYRNDKGELVKDKSDSLDKYYEYLKSRVNTDAYIDDDNEIILGVSANNNIR